MVRQILKFIAAVLASIQLTAGAADFSYTGTPEYFTLNIKGEIQPGDYRKLVEFLSSEARPTYRLLKNRFPIWINSNGGSIQEATKIASWVRDAYIPVWVIGTCKSACFVIYAASVDRYAQPNIVGIHRPYFGREMAKSLSLEETKIAYETMATKYYNTLLGYDVPRYLIEKMKTLASTEIYMLESEDIDAIGKRAPFYEQYLMANCGLNKKIENEWSARVRKEAGRAVRTEAERVYFDQVRDCTVKYTFPIAVDVTMKYIVNEAQLAEQGK